MKEENNNSKKEIIESNEIEKTKITKENDTSNEVKYKVDIKGAIIQPGIYTMNINSRIIEKTTTNMIQKISPIFTVNPLISKEI